MFRVQHYFKSLLYKQFQNTLKGNCIRLKKLKSDVHIFLDICIHDVTDDFLDLNSCALL